MGDQILQVRIELGATTSEECHQTAPKSLFPTQLFIFLLRSAQQLRSPSGHQQTFNGRGPSKAHLRPVEAGMGGQVPVGPPQDQGGAGTSRGPEAAQLLEGGRVEAVAELRRFDLDEHVGAAGSSTLQLLAGA